MKKISLFFILLFMISCMGSKTEVTSIVKEEIPNQQEVVINEESDVEIAEEEHSKEQIEKEIQGEDPSLEVAENKGEIKEELEKKPEIPTDWKVIRNFKDEITIKKNIKYQGELPEELNYVIIVSPRINLRERPTTKSQILGEARQGQRLEVLELVKYKDGTEWYKIKDKGKELFVYKKIVTLREFRFEKSREKINELEEFIETAKKNGKEVSTINAYVPNPNNKDLLRDKDRYGNVQDQSADAYYKGDKIYVPDGTIVAIEEDLGGKYRIRKQDGEELYLDISKNWISRKNKIIEMPKKAVVIDIKNQNFTVYEKLLGEWSMISYAYGKTGSESKLGFKTPRGSFAVLTTKKIMTYNDSEGERQGYANYAIRFSGGGYIHGTPFNIEEIDELEKFRKQKELTLGAYPGTRKCVRNTIDHGKFLFDWVVGTKVKDGNFQGIEEKVTVIVM